MRRSAGLRILLAIVLIAATTACETTQRSIDFSPLPNTPRTRAKVDVSGVTYNLKLDQDYPISRLQAVLDERLREHLQARGLEIVPAAEAQLKLTGEITLVENVDYNGWLAVSIAGGAAGGLLVLGIPFGFMLVMVGAMTFVGTAATAGLGWMAAGLAGPGVIAASLAAPDKTFAKEFTAAIAMQDAAGKRLYEKKYDYRQSDDASVYGRDWEPAKTINRTMSVAIDALFSQIAEDLAAHAPPSLASAG
jgi:hypothetical protein